MEYHFFQKIQRIPYFVRIFLGIICITLGVITTLVPILPGALFLFTIGLLFLVSARKVQKVRKIRRGLFYLFKNFSTTKLKHKWYDIKNHLKHIIFHDD